MIVSSHVTVQHEITVVTVGVCNSHIVSHSTWPGVTYKRSGEFLGPICITSLVPRLPCSGTRTLKLCRRGEPGIFCHMKSAKGREEVERT